MPTYYAQVPFEVTREEHYVVITFEGEFIIKIPIRNGGIQKKIPLISLQWIFSNGKVKGYTKFKSEEANRAFRIIFGDAIEKALQFA